MTKLTKEQFAYMLDGRQRGEELSGYDDITAASSRLVVCICVSDDLFKAYGRITGEAGCWQGCNVYFCGDAVLSENEAWLHLKNNNEPDLKKIRVLYQDKNENIKHCYWQFKTEIPHAAFNIYDGDEIYCEGIVIAYNDIYPDQ